MKRERSILQWNVKKLTCHCTLLVKEMPIVYPSRSAAPRIGIVTGGSLKVFVCRFCVGDRFYLCENKILCEYDYEERLVFANMAYNPPPLSHLKRQTTHLSPPPVCISLWNYARRRANCLMVDDTRVRYSSVIQCYG